MEYLAPVKAKHAKQLFQFVYQSDITQTIKWNGPESFNEYHESLKTREQMMIDKEIHMFTIIDPKSKSYIGSADIRPYQDCNIADIGFWIARDFHGQGLGTKVVKELLDYSFNYLQLDAVEAFVFLGNLASKKVLEKNGFVLQGIEKERVLKNGQKIDEWKFQITKSQSSKTI